MINAVLAGFEKFCHFKDFYFGMKLETIQFYQLGGGYLTLFSHLYRQTANGHYLHRPASDPLVRSPLRSSAQRLGSNALRGKQALAQDHFSVVLTAIGQQIMLATATIAASDQGLYLAATLYNKAESFDRYRTFVEAKWPLSTAVDSWFNEAIALTTLLVASEEKKSEGISIRQQLSNFQCHRLAMNRLYVLVNQGFFLLNHAAIDITPFLAALHQSHLSERWTLTQQQKFDYFAQQQRDIREVLFEELQDGLELCYGLESGELIQSPNTSKPDISQAVQSFTQQLRTHSSPYTFRDKMAKGDRLNGMSAPMAVVE